MIGPLLERSTPGWLQAVLCGRMNRRVPLRNILYDSLFYPACGLNGTPVKYLGGNIHSFIYADYGVSRSMFLKNLHGTGRDCGFKGYRLVRQMDLHRDQLVPRGWIPPLVPEPSFDTVRLNAVEASADPFCHWSVWRRKRNLSHSHGPEAFSFLFVCGEMSAVYQGLYTNNGMKPKVLAIIQPGCMGGEWENPESDDSFFRKVVRANPAGMPEYLLHGGFGRGFYEKPCWKDYGGEMLIRLPERYAALWRLSSIQRDQTPHSNGAMDYQTGEANYPEKACRSEPFTGPGFFLTLKSNEDGEGLTGQKVAERKTKTLHSREVQHERV